MAPVTVGILLDRGETHMVLWLLAAMLILAVMTTMLIGRLDARSTWMTKIEAAADRAKTFSAGQYYFQVLRTWPPSSASTTRVS